MNGLALMMVISCMATAALGEGEYTNRLPRNPFHRNDDWSFRRDSGSNGSTARNGGVQRGGGVRSARPPVFDAIDRNEYPYGHNGPRLVTITIKPGELDINEFKAMREHVYWDRHWKSELAKLQEMHRDWSQRLNWIAPRQRDSSDEYFAFIDTRSRVLELEREIGEVKAQIQMMPHLRKGLEDFIKTKGETTITFNVLNHQKRGDVPKWYLRKKAIALIYENHYRMGERLRMNF